MSFLDILSLAGSNLWRRKMRTMLTVLGVIIGTACIVIMIALGLGNLEQFNESIMQSTNLNQIQVYGGGGRGEGSQLNEAVIEEFKQLSGVKSATGTLDIPSYIVMGRYASSSSVAGVDPDAMDFSFMEGGVFSDSDAIEIVVGYNARQWFEDARTAAAGDEMFFGGGMVVMAEEAGGEESVGPDIDWLNEPAKYYPNSIPPDEMEEITPENPAPKEYKAVIAGVLEEANDPKSYSMYMSMNAARKLIRENRKLMDNMGIKEDVYTQAYVNCTDVDQVSDVLKQIQDMGFQAYSDTEWINQMKDEQLRQQSQLIAIGLISLFVSAIGIANTMLASILERRREIGVMKVIGLSISKINLMFLVEAAMIGLIGGLIGLGVSYIFAAAANTGGSEVSFLGMYFSEGVRLSIPWWLSFGAIAIATGVGIVSGIYPAIQATKMSPLEAIRSGE